VTSHSPERTVILAILLLAANPGSENVLSLEAEAREIKNELERSIFHKHFDLHSRWVRDSDVFIATLSELEPTILHFSGHGSNDGLFGVGADGLPTRVQGRAIGRLIHGSPSVRMVVLCACYSEMQAREISEFVDFVVGMPASVDDVAARTFSAAFYEVLSTGHSVAIAFHFAEMTLTVHYPDVRLVLYAQSSIHESLAQ